MSRGRPDLREKWYSEGWYSARTCSAAFRDGWSRYGEVPLVFVAAGAHTTVTVGEIGALARTVAAGLRRLGVRRGDAVAVQLTNRLECAVAYQATLLCGAVLVPIVHIYGAAEVGFILAQSGASTLIMPHTFRSTRYVDRVCGYRDIPTLRNIVVLDAEPGDGFTRWEELVQGPGEWADPAADADDVCVMLYTSGTTSAPKGVRHSHNSILAEQRTRPGLLAGDPDSVELVSFPPGHVGGLSAVLGAMISGTRTVFVDTWDPCVAADLIQRFGVTTTVGTPFHLHGLLELSNAATKLRTLREFLTGAAPVTDEIGRRAAAAGINAYRCYGLTEHPTVSGTHRCDPSSVRLGTDGLPMPGSAVRVLGEDGTDQPHGVPGEVVTQGPDQFIGYHDPALDAAAFTSDGWFRTGDLGYLDDSGHLVITDRIKDVIIRAGETISSAQVEDVLLAHPAVAEGVAVAAPDPLYGEVVAAVVVLRTGVELDLPELQRHFARSGLARQKTPERLVVTDTLPRTALGKVLKTDLRRALHAETH